MGRRREGPGLLRAGEHPRRTESRRRHRRRLRGCYRSARGPAHRRAARRAAVRRRSARHAIGGAAPIDELERLLALYKLYFKIGPQRALPLDQPTTRELQRILLRAGRYDGEATGRYDDATRGALRELFGIENLEERWTDEPAIDEAALGFLRTRFRE